MDAFVVLGSEVKDPTKFGNEFGRDLMKTLPDVVKNVRMSWNKQTLSGQVPPPLIWSYCNMFDPFDPPSTPLRTPFRPSLHTIIRSHDHMP